MDGIKAAMTIRQSPESRDCVLILVTADLLANDDKATTSCFNHVILKPITRGKVIPLLPT